MKSADVTVNTMASRVRAAGGGGFSDAILDAFHELETQDYQISADTKISEAYRQERRAELTDRIDATLRAAEERDIAAARKPLEQERARILAEIKGVTDRPDHLLETSDTQRERIGRRTIEALALNADLTLATASHDPNDLMDLFTETMIGQSPDRIRRLGPVIITRLKTLADAKVDDARDLHLQAWSEYQTWGRKNPSRAARLRQLDTDLAHIDRPVRAKYIRAREVWKFGAHAHGMQM